MSKKVKKFAIIILVIAAVIWGVSLFGNKEPVSQSGLSSSANDIQGPISVAAPQGQASGEFASLLSSIRSIVIDTSVFSDPSYKALRDHPISLGTDVIGRSNPFAPVGTDIDQRLVNPTVQTLQPGKVTATGAEFSAQVSFATTAPVSVVFQYGPSDQFGSATSPQVINKSGTVVATVSGLSSGLTYYVQAVAVVGSTTTSGNTMTFSTLGN